MKTTIDDKGQTVIPEELRRLDHLHAGDDFSIHRLGPGRYLYEKVSARPGRAEVIHPAGEPPLIVTPEGAPPLTREQVRRIADGLLE